jgi:hypothetical protein
MDTEGHLSRNGIGKWLESLGAVTLDKHMNLYVVLPKRQGEPVLYDKYMNMLDAYSDKHKSKDAGNFNMKMKSWKPVTTK